MTLSIGGDDVTEFLYVLMGRISFPYKEFDLARLHDRLVIEDLKCRICTLNEVRLSKDLGSPKWCRICRITISHTGRRGPELVRLRSSAPQSKAHEIWVKGLRRSHPCSHGEEIQVTTFPVFNVILSSLSLSPVWLTSKGNASGCAGYLILMYLTK